MLLSSTNPLGSESRLSPKLVNCQPCEGIFQIFFVFSHFFARASNSFQYSNFGNKCPKLGTRTPEDMVLINLGDSVDFDPSGFVLVYMTSHVELTASQVDCEIAIFHYSTHLGHSIS